jgi:radical SAM superfamily enzyme YgiQ (UPF0313 family)
MGVGLLKIGFFQVTNPLDVQWFSPLSFGYLKSYAERESGGGIEFFRLSEEELFHRSFDLLTLSAASQDFGDCCDLVRRFREVNPNCPIILGGHHITYLPETLPREVNVGVIGEGEVTFAQIVRLFQEEGRLSPRKLMEILGVVYWDDGKTVRTGPRPLIENLDGLPMPYRKDDEVPYLFSSRGCPFRCAFCTSSAFWGQMRYFSAEYVVREIEQIVEQYGEKVTHLTFMDDLMTLNRPRLRKMAALLSEKDLTRRINFSMAVKAGRVDDDLCRILKEMNVSDVFFGAESAVDWILEFLKVGTQTVAQNQSTLDILARQRIPVALSLIVGVPGETESDIQDTYSFIMRNLRDHKIYAASVNILMPMPGTRIWEKALEMGVFDLQNIEWQRLSCFAYYKNSTIRNISDWIRTRKERRSYYVNEEGIPHEKLLSLMEKYETMIEEKTCVTG